MAKSAYVKVSSPANIGGVMTECQVTVKSHPESNNFVRYRYQSAGNIYTRYGQIDTIVISRRPSIRFPIED